MILIQELLRVIAASMYLKNLAPFLFERGFVTASFFNLFEVVFSCIAMIAVLKIRTSRNADVSRAAVVSSFFALILPALLKSGIQIGSEKFAIALIVFGITIASVSIFDLWHHFDILPAYRGIVRDGAYKLVRHPVYLGYILILIGNGFLNFSIWNCIISALIVLCLDLRARLEEKHLASTSNEYQNYLMLVRYRFVPRVY